MPQNCFILGNGERISRVMVTHGHVVDAIGFEIVGCGNPRRVWFSPPQTSNTAITTELPLGDDEEITNISGYYGKYGGHQVILKLRIHTTTTTHGHGEYGSGERARRGQSFHIPPEADDGALAGFFGSWNTYLSSLGVYTKHGLDVRCD